MKYKVMSLRLRQELAEELEAVARVDATSLSDVIRDAIASHIAARRADTAFQARLRKRLETEREVLERLGR